MTKPVANLQPYLLSDEHREALTRVLPFTGGTHTLDDVLQGVEEGRFIIWPGHRSVIVTEIVDTPGHSILVFFLAAGSMREMRRLYPIILAWGKTQGCTRARIVGRKGWERSFITREEGFTPTAVVFEKEIPYG